MADNRTEKPTKRRLDKARSEGRFPVSRQLVAAAQFLSFVAMLGWLAPQLLIQLRAVVHDGLGLAFRRHITLAAVMAIYVETASHLFAPVLLAGAGMLAIEVGAQLGATRLGISLQKLTPELARLNPLARIKDLPAQNFTSSIQVIVLFPVIAIAVYSIVQQNLAAYLDLPGLSLAAALGVISGSLMAFLWKAGCAFAVIGCLDFLRQKRSYNKSLQMTKQELREEAKETHGNPEIKGRIRRLQRDAARRNMMKEVPKATAVIVNPTHYSVAIRYEMESMAAPRVVAKGKNYLALRIRQIASEHQVPIVENMPLAQALYQSADVGQEIPPHLYRAVAEILAYIFKLMRGRKA